MTIRSFRFTNKKSFLKKFLKINNSHYEKKLGPNLKECFKVPYYNIDSNKISMIMTTSAGRIACSILVEPLKHECIIWDVCTGSRYRSQGCMKELFKHMFKFFNRYHRFSLSVYKNNTGAISFYKKMGFKIISEFEGPEGPAYKMLCELEILGNLNIRCSW